MSRSIFVVCSLRNLQNLFLQKLLFVGVLQNICSESFCCFPWRTAVTISFFERCLRRKKTEKKKDSVTSVFLEILPIFLERLFFGTVLVDCICFLQFLDYMMSKATPVWFDIFFNNLHHYVNLRKTRVCSYVGRSFMRT